MRDKIIKLIENNTHQSREWIAYQILALFRWEGWLHKDDSVEGLQVERECPDCNGFGSVIEKTTEVKNNHWVTRGEKLQCGMCFGTGKITSPFTASDALTMIRGLLEVSPLIAICLEDWIQSTGFGEVNRRDRKALAELKKALTIPSGGRVVIGKEEK
jgi:hypothetical protein